MWYNRRGLGSFRALFLGAAGTYSTDELEELGLDGDDGTAASPFAIAIGLDGHAGAAASISHCLIFGTNTFGGATLAS